jgi:hypothetical protein
MKKAKKIIWVIVILALVLIISAVAVVGLCLDKIVKAGVENVGPKIVQVPVTVDTINLSLLTGSAKVKNFVIGNPDGYKTPFAISVGTASIGVNSLTVLSDKIVVRSIEIHNPEITFEGGLGGNNLGKIMDNVNEVSKSGGPATTNAAAKAKPAQKIEVDDLIITGAKVHGTVILFGGKEVTLPSLLIPDIHLKDLGKGNAGLTPTDLTRAVLQAITSATMKTVSNAAADIAKNMGTLGKQGLNQIKSGLGGLFGK